MNAFHQVFDPCDGGWIVAVGQFELVQPVYGFMELFDHVVVGWMFHDVVVEHGDTCDITSSCVSVPPSGQPRGNNIWYVNTKEFVSGI